MIYRRQSLTNASWISEGNLTTVLLSGALLAWISDRGKLILCLGEEEIRSLGCCAELLLLLVVQNSYTIVTWRTFVFLFWATDVLEY